MRDVRTQVRANGRLRTRVRSDEGRAHFDARERERMRVWKNREFPNFVRAS
jgi:hypothetical protein